MYCFNCGTQIKPEAHFCFKCGIHLKNINSFHRNPRPLITTEEVPAIKTDIEINLDDNCDYRKRYSVLAKLYNLERISFYAWIVIVIFQVVMGFVTQRWGLLLLATWNSFFCYHTRTFMNNLIHRPVDILKRYDNGIVINIIFALINLLIFRSFLGALGAALGIYISCIGNNQQTKQQLKNLEERIVQAEHERYLGKR